MEMQVFDTIILIIKSLLEIPGPLKNFFHFFHHFDERVMLATTIYLFIKEFIAAY